jgi:uncharacterized protein (TIGR02145 family)
MQSSSSSETQSSSSSETQSSSAAVVFEQCGSGNYYNPETHFCQEGTEKILPLCGGDTYTQAQFCYESKVEDKCGINPQEYDPDEYECKPSINPNGIFLKTPVPYEGEDYEAVLIDTQVWMAKNLNYNANGSVCYDGDPANCAQYGKLYYWIIAMGFDEACNSTNCNSQVDEKHQGVCPNGWHIPSNADWNTLMAFVHSDNRLADYNLNATSNYAGKYLKATSGWNSYQGTSGNGLDTYGFSALPGSRGYSGGNFSGVGSSGYWWSASELNSTEAEIRWMGYHNENVEYSKYGKYYMQSVRCVKN